MGEPQVSKWVDATPDQVWEVLADGWRYAEWVRGTKEIREVEPGWPGVGTSIHYSAGVGPLVKRDRTTSRRMEPTRHLELEILAWPFGTARVALNLEPDGAGTTVHMQEHPLRGVGRLLHTALSKAGFALRMRLMLDDLARLAERR